MFTFTIDLCPFQDIDFNVGGRIVFYRFHVESSTKIGLFVQFAATISKVFDIALKKIPENLIKTWGLSTNYVGFRNGTEILATQQQFLLEVKM